MNKDKKLLIILTVVIIAILGVTLYMTYGSYSSNVAQEGRPAPAPEGTGNIGSGSLGFGQTLLTPPESVSVKEEVSVPRKVKVYPILPAPFEYFSVEAVQAIAQKLGFTEAATATQKSGFYVYREGERTLTINPEAGTIQFSLVGQPGSQTVGQLDVNQARTKVKTLMQSLNLDLPIVNWNGAQFTTNGMLKPTLEVAGLSLIPPIDYYARFDSGGELVGLSYWLPNLDYESAEEMPIINAEEARKKVRQGKAIVVRGDISTLNKLTFNNLSLQYLVRPEVIYNLTRVQKLRPVYVFQNEDVTLYVDAVEK